MGGDQLLAEALRLWGLYAAITRPTSVSRVSLRYINRLDLPLSHGQDFEIFLRSPPELPADAPQMVSRFLSRVTASDENSSATAIVTQKLDRPAMPVPVIIDIDAFWGEDSDPGEAILHRILMSLRALKNRCFFALLTDDAVKLYT